MCSRSKFSRFISEKTHLTIQQNSFFSFLFLKRALSSHLSIDCQYSCCKKFCISGLLMLNADLYLANYFFFSVVKLVNWVYTELYSSQQEVLTCIYILYSLNFQSCMASNAILDTNDCARNPSFSCNMTGHPFSVTRSASWRRRGTGISCASPPSIITTPTVRFSSSTSRIWQAIFWRYDPTAGFIMNYVNL